MRGVYGNRRGIVIGVDGSVREAAVSPALSTHGLLEQAKVAAVLTLSSVAAIVSLKVLFPAGARRRNG